MRKILLMLFSFQTIFANTTFVDQNNRFAINLYNSFDNENLIYSPFSIYTALSMVYPGSNGKTKKIMEEVLDFNPKTSSNSANFGKVLKKLRKKMTIANGLFVDEDTSLLRNFSWQLKNYFSTQAQKVPFKDDPKESTDIINKWIARNTENTIKELLSEKVIDKYTRLVLVNTLLLKKKFLTPFSKVNTNDQFFYPENLPSIKVPMMEKLASYSYSETEDYQALTLPLEDEFSLTILLPKAPSSLSTIEKELSTDFIHSIFASSKKETVKVKLPKFKIEKSFNLNSALSALGLSNLFSAGANFSKINGKENLAISQVEHKALFELNESGILASAATAAVIGFTSAGPQEATYNFTANHPFLFFIADTDHRLLFLGKFESPER